MLECLGSPMSPAQFTYQACLCVNTIHDCIYCCQNSVSTKQTTERTPIVLTLTAVIFLWNDERKMNFSKSEQTISVDIENDDIVVRRYTPMHVSLIGSDKC